MVERSGTPVRQPREERTPKGVTEILSFPFVLVMPLSNEKMPKASDKGSQPYRNALGCFEMAGESDTTNTTLPLGKGHTLHMSPTQGQAILLGVISYQPFRSPYGGSCMAGYHCLMPIGIPSGVIQPISNI